VLQLSEVQDSPSEQFLAEPARQLPVPLQVSLRVQALPSLQLLLLDLLDHTVREAWLAPGRHAWHWFAGFCTPSTRQVPPMRHQLSSTWVLSQPLAVQVFLVQAMPSSQLVLPVHAPAPLQVSIGLQRLPSSQDVPVSALLQPLGVRVGSQIWHCCPGRRTPAA